MGIASERGREGEGREGNRNKSIAIHDQCLSSEEGRREQPNSTEQVGAFVGCCDCPSIQTTNVGVTQLRFRASQAENYVVGESCITAKT